MPRPCVASDVVAVLLLAVTASACSDGTATPKPAARPIAGYDCGRLNPNLAVTCAFGGSPPTRLADENRETVDVPEGPDGVSGHLELECDLTPAEDPGRTTLVEYRAWCRNIESGAERFEQEIGLESHGERECGTGEHGSAAVFAPVWTSTVELSPSSVQRKIELTVDATDRHADECDVTIGGILADPIEAPGIRRIFTGFFEGGQQIPIGIDCHSKASIGFMFNSCYGFTPGELVSPVVRDVRATFSVVVH